MMSCRYKDYDPVRLAEGGGDWLEEEPNPSLSPKAVRTFFFDVFRVVVVAAAVVVVREEAILDPWCIY